MVLILLVLGAISTLSVAGFRARASVWCCPTTTEQARRWSKLRSQDSFTRSGRLITPAGGVTSFLTDVANTMSWTALMGTSALQMPGYSNITYTVNYAASPAATATNMSRATR